ncbi:binding-protein-dependent transport systems inner membrane component [Paenibacillus mucilaginosus 3016]|uniref:Binding-protein-dependent transport systems inner membrane component n=2 Tax=Paenibacillus mucilaginosus TaxID=61624 RepID=H6NAD5_9BACL|nr:carbohydrate ABC transporter permease [Paenibacillus mucilaginosus]AFC29381.1 binding-protein-dependent transport systems inner membrane component [Paenibacillus mucilaginosus 3016]AFH61561.1 ABC transporter permease [Paenibacillus mucilaginosus K02]WFA18096.1 carbohydrate ABC transporter permease [Paenibacillus mucilaginosus]
MHHISAPYRWFLRFNYAVLTVLALLCLFPLVNILAISFSSSGAVAAGKVTFWPVDWTLSSYTYMMENRQFTGSFLISLTRVALGTAVNLVLTILVAYPLSKDARTFRSRTVYAWIFVFTMLFGGGLIPTYLVVKETGMLNSVWALILPGAVPIFNVLLMLNFFRGLPKELEEAAWMDGAGHFRTLWSVYLPVSLPSIATVTLFTVVGHWNAWFDGMIYMKSPEHHPLATYLQSMLQQQLNVTTTTGMSLEEADRLSRVSDRTTQASQIFLSVVPILVLYPFLQRYFVKGLVVGSVKG